MNTNKNTYTIIYASVVVIIVSFLLAFVSSALSPQSQANERIDKKKQILASLRIRNIDNADVEARYAEVVQQEADAGHLPLYICKVDGKTKYVLPLSGRGLWGGISGYIALNDDKNTIYGIFFTHESETAGLGARITDEDFQQEFVGKQVFKDGAVAISVVKNGQVKNPQTECDGITGATLTSNGVSEMLHQSISKYIPYLRSEQK